MTEDDSPESVSLIPEVSVEFPESRGTVTEPSVVFPESFALVTDTCVIPPEPRVVFPESSVAGPVTAVPMSVIPESRGAVDAVGWPVMSDTLVLLVTGERSPAWLRVLET